MQTLNGILQGSPEWLQARAKHFCASEAAAMLGLSRYTSRTELLRQKATGATEDVDPAKQRLFDRGHQAEAQARPIAERIIGEELYPVVGVKVADGLPLLASLDGLTMLGETIWENKLTNASLIDQVERGELEPLYWAQLEHQMLVSEAERALFTASDGTEENTHSCWYTSQPERRQQIIDGWKLFAADLAAYVPEVAAAPAPTGKAPESLPALHIVINGGVQASNLAEFKATALAVFQGINRNLTTDAEFADAEKTVKWCGDVEDRLKAAKEHALSQTESIDTLFRTIDDISAEARRVRLDLDKLVKARKEQIREEIVMDGRKALASHIDGLNTRLGKPYMPAIQADFAGAIKSKRTVDSLRDAVNTTLANAKIEASAIADRIQINLGTLCELAKDHAFLFADAAQIVLKAPDDLTALVKLRIAEHQQAEAARLEAERERIRKEEEAKAERAAREAHEKARAAVAAIRFPAPEPVAAAEPATPAPSLVAANNAAKAEIAQVAPVATSGPLITTQALSDRLGLPVQATLIESLGFKSIKQSKPGVYWRDCDVRAIGWALIEHIKSHISEAVAA